MNHPNVVIREDAELLLKQFPGLAGQLDGSTIVVTGANGFLCSYLVDVLANWAETGACRLQIVAVDNLISGIGTRLAHYAGSTHVRVVQHDVTKPLPLTEAVDHIVHGASIASPVFYRKYPLETIDVNVGGTSQLLAFAHKAKAKSFLYLSSSEIYGDPTPDAIPTNEEYRGNVSCTGPRACYDESKRVGETLCTTYFRLYGTRTRIVRPFNVYGPGQRLDDQRIVPDLVSAALAEKPLQLLSDGRPTRSFCYARDFIAGLLLVMLKGDGGEAFNVGNDEEISIRTAAETVAKVARPSNPLEITFAKSSDADYLTDNPNRRCPDLSKIKARTGWVPKTTFREGIERTLRSYRT